MSETSSGSQGSEKTIEVGFVVDIWTRRHDRDRDTHGFVGEVQAVDERGMRITHIDWLVGSFVGSDVFVPWREVREITIATPDHDVGLFLKEIWNRSAQKTEKEADVPF